jgi:hypothetical protein
METRADASALKRTSRRRVMAVTVYSRYSGERSNPCVYNQEASEDEMEENATGSFTVWIGKAACTLAVKVKA